jgi:hypothetical protein
MYESIFISRGLSLDRLRVLLEVDESAKPNK